MIFVLSIANDLRVRNIRSRGDTVPRTRSHGGIVAGINGSPALVRALALRDGRSRRSVGIFGGYREKKDRELFAPKEEARGVVRAHLR